MGFVMNAKDIARLHWHSIKELLPYKSHMFTLVGHIDNKKTMSVKIGIFDPISMTWGAVGDSCEKNGEEGFLIEDITDWVDCWAEVPPEELE